MKSTAFPTRVAIVCLGYLSMPLIALGNHGALNGIGLILSILYVGLVVLPAIFLFFANAKVLNHPSTGSTFYAILSWFLLVVNGSILSMVMDVPAPASMLTVFFLLSALHMTYRSVKRFKDFVDQ